MFGATSNWNLIPLNTSSWSKIYVIEIKGDIELYLFV